MLPHVILIGRLAIDVEQFLSVAKQATGRSPSKKLDQLGKSTVGVGAYLAMLSSLKNEQSEINNVLENPGHLLVHCYYSFMIISDINTLDDLREQTRLAIHTTPLKNNLYLTVVSSNLEEWRSAIINGCSDQAGENMRLLFDRILILFENEGLGRLWSNYIKKTLTDTTFKLIERK